MFERMSVVFLRPFILNLCECENLHFPGIKGSNFEVDSFLFLYQANINFWYD